MKNKMKAWRRAATKINKEQGKKHCGRKFKYVYSPIQQTTGLYPLLAQLLIHAEIVTVGQ